MRSVVGDTAARFGRAIIMPNLRPPVSTVAQAMSYRERILDAIPEGLAFNPLMTLYLTEHTTPDEIVLAARSEHVVGVKLYPAGATTNSDAGVTGLAPVLPVLDAMAQLGVPLLIHGEDTDPATDVFDREKRFIDEVLAPLVEKMPKLKVVLEHVTTEDAVAFVSGAREGVAATITAHHLLLNRNAIFAGGIRPHAYCLPVLKRERHREALLGAATSGSSRFFLGTDSAPHPVSAKENPCGCAGIYTAHAGIELYAEAFDQVGALDELEGFASFFGPDFYGLPRNETSLTLRREEWKVPARLAFGDEELVPMRGGQTVAWSIAD
jgi:dihydroorotase